MIAIRQIAVKPERKGPMEIRETVLATLSVGIVGDIRGTAPGRQITIISMEQWEDACQEIGESLPWTCRRANLLIAGHRFSEEDIGRKLLIGYNVLLEITNELTPCKRMDEAHPKLQEALQKNFRGGVTCSVVKGGTIHQGDRILREA